MHRVGVFARLRAVKLATRDRTHRGARSSGHCISCQCLSPVGSWLRESRPFTAHGHEGCSASMRALRQPGRYRLRSSCSSSTSSCRMSVSQPSSEPTLGVVRPRSPWQNSFT